MRNIRLQSASDWKILKDTSPSQLSEADFYCVRSFNVLIFLGQHDGRRKQLLEHKRNCYQHR